MCVRLCTCLPAFQSSAPWGNVLDIPSNFYGVFFNLLILVHPQLVMSATLVFVNHRVHLSCHKSHIFAAPAISLRLRAILWFVHLQSVKWAFWVLFFISPFGRVLSEAHPRMVAWQASLCPRPNGFDRQCAAWLGPEHTDCSIFFTPHILSVWGWECRWRAVDVVTLTEFWTRSLDYGPFFWFSHWAVPKFGAIISRRWHPPVVFLALRGGDLHLQLSWNAKYLKS